VGVRAGIFAGAVLLALLVRTTVLPAVAVASFRPDVLLLVVIAAALLEGPDTGIRLGFAAGLVQDLVSGGEALVGLGALVVMGTGWAAGRLRPYLAANPRSGSIVVSGLLTAGATIATGVLGGVFGVINPSAGRVLGAAVVVGLYSAAVSPLVTRPLQGALRQFPPASA
jgi:rod shape-determining protein MreD